MRHTPVIITGENFESDGLELWVWAPPGNDDGDALRDALRQRPRGEAPALPAEPPEDAQRIRPIDVDGQVIVAVITHARARRAVLWIGNEHGVSAPYLYNVAKPLWISDEGLSPGDLLRVFGYGLRREYRENRIALKNGDQVVFLQDHGRRPDRASRNPFYISYETRLLEMHLPEDLDPGDYELFVHNGWGGEFGWRKAGDLAVIPASDAEERIIDARRDFDAVGDGLSNDTAPLQAAIDAAAEAGGGKVYIPPGTYMIDRSLRVRSGVTLRGAGQSNTVIEGFGFEPDGEGGRDVPDWYSLLRAPYSVVLLEPVTAMENLAVKGSVAQGGGGHGMVELISGSNEGRLPEHFELGKVALEDVHLHSQVFHPDYGMPGARFYHSALRAGRGWRSPGYRLKVVNCVLDGDLRMGTMTRTDIIGNTIRKGAIQSGGLFDSLIDANVMEENPYRMYSYRPVWNSYYRSNEIRNFGNRRVSGASEPFMLHGGAGKSGGQPTEADARSLTDTDQSWEPGHFRERRRGSAVLITAGRGFGQYRRVVDNTEDTLTIDEPWRVVPDETSEYVVGGFFINTVFYDNFNDGLGRLTLWLDCINVVVENHRNNMSGGMDIWGSDRSGDERPDRYAPSWYNMLLGNEMEGSRIYLHDTMEPDNHWAGPVLFGNYIVSNNIVRPMHRNVRQNTYPTPAINAGVDAYANRADPLERDPGRNSYSMIVNNTIAHTDVGIRIPEGVRKTFVLRNDFMSVEHPILDFGSGTVIDEANRERYIDPEDGQVDERLLHEVVPSPSE